MPTGPTGGGSRRCRREGGTQASLPPATPGTGGRPRVSILPAVAPEAWRFFRDPSHRGGLVSPVPSTPRAGDPPSTRDKKGRRVMPHVITTRCVDVKDQSCVEVCPVDCIHPASRIDGQGAFDAAPQLYIDPTVCIVVHAWPSVRCRPSSWTTRCRKNCLGPSKPTPPITARKHKGMARRLPTWDRHLPLVDTPGRALVGYAGRTRRESVAPLRRLRRDVTPSSLRRELRGGATGPPTEKAGGEDSPRRVDGTSSCRSVTNVPASPVPIPYADNRPTRAEMLSSIGSDQSKDEEERAGERRSWE